MGRNKKNKNGNNQQSQPVTTTSKPVVPSQEPVPQSCQVVESSPVPPLVGPPLTVSSSITPSVEPVSGVLYLNNDNRPKQLLVYQAPEPIPQPLPVYQEPQVQSLKPKGKQPLGEPRNFKPKVIWIWGETGAGKTYYVTHKEKDLWISPAKDLKWWHGYKNQEATLFDDFTEDFCKFKELLRYLDNTECPVEIKCGCQQLNSKRMYITSSQPPDRIYTKLRKDENINQLLRRIDEIIEMKADVVLSVVRIDTIRNGKRLNE